ncbi:pseudouridine synthase [Terriglobus tenax]|uniref:pseudouridine synthase n=1 Tax=Terriglobus tenax TaxID=1111115 RepID=UPI0021E0AE01|nr:pseudouridine synthase [Terriglobus tenax]
MSEPVRLQKIIAQAGLASRRASEELILSGRVTLNGEIVTELGTKADPEKDHIRVDGKLLQGPQRHRYFVLNKPRGYVTTLRDPEGRPTILELLAQSPKAPRERLYPVGRLDYLSEGLIILTNDGELANSLSKAASGVAKTYLVKVSGQPSPEAIQQLRTGIMIERGRLQEGQSARRNRVLTQPAEIELTRGGENPWYSVTLTEGRNRQLRKMFEEVGHHVEKIRRIAYGGLVLDVEPGEFRELTPGEVTALGRASQGRKVERKKVLPEAAKLKEPGKPKRKPGFKSGFKPAGPKRRSR